MDEIAKGIYRVTFPIPFGIDHVHCYLVRSDSGGWILVDTAVTLAGVRARWEAALAPLEGHVDCVFVTHFHPDHVGGAELVGSLARAPVLQGRVDYDYCLGAWGDPDAGALTEATLVGEGMPPEEAHEVRAHHEVLASVTRFARDPVLVEAGERIGGWEVLHLPGHADGHLALLRDGVLVAGDALLGDISPNVGIYPLSGPDPLGAFFETLDRIASLDLDLALPGHGAALHDPAARARELRRHHRERLEEVADAVELEPQTPYALSHRLFPGDLGAAARRMAVAETLAHLEHLALRSRLGRRTDAGVVVYSRH